MCLSVRVDVIRVCMGVSEGLCQCVEVCTSC